MRTDVANLYVALFGRAPERDGLGYWVNQLDAGKTVAQVAQEMYNTDPARATYPTFLTNEEIIGRFYTNVLGRTADADGLAYWTSKLNAGATKGAVISEMITAVRSFAGTGTDATSVAARDSKALFENKVTVGLYYAVEKGGNDVTAATNILVGVTKDAATVEAAKTGASSAVGKSFTLTVNQDSGANFVGGTGNDTFTASAAQDGAGTLTNTLQNVDVLDGGDGTDTLVATLAQGATVASSIKNIENLNLRFAAAGAKMDLANTTGATAITVADSTTAGVINNIGTIASLAIKSQNQNVSIGGTAGSATTLALNLDTVGTSTAAITLDLGVDNASKATTANITANNAFVKVDSTNADVLTTATIAATGTNAINFADSAATLTSVTVTGAGSVDLTGTALAVATKLDASASTGAIKATLTQAAKAVTVTTGTGNDVINASAVATVGSSANLGAGNDTLFTGANLAAFDKGANGGDGTDIINITDGSKLDATTSKYITNFETLDVSGGTGNYDVSLNSFATVQIDEAIAGALAGDVDFKNAADTFTLTISSKAKTNADFDVVKNITVTGKDYTGTTAKGDAETFTLVAQMNDANKDDASDGNINAQTVTVAGVENLVVDAKVASTDGGVTGAKSSAYTLTAKFVAAAAETVTIKGDAKVDLSGVTTIGVVSKIDATANTGGTKIDLSTHTKSVAFTGGDGVDTYAGSKAGDIVYTGKGADAVTFIANATAAVRDTFVLKAATDSQISDTSKDGKVTLAADTGFDSITNFKTGAAATDDRLDLTNFNFSGAQRGVVDVNVKIATTAVDLTSIASLFNDPAGNRGVAISQAGTGDTYVFIDANKDGNFTAADDIVIKLAGVATISETNINF
ncbi:hypothetical protein AYR66_05355 [Noviherbaspirillum denitrificans]|uniref:DUF4214 domain-containing protein n=2 Tax=Noviherbaspirillum denitrificans TaxID=1968433 RepID=A0A254T8P0_9BURK|nr:hypothetical protein AYR66_05355 [Noviherbaspirillum denitrificans]